jgi:hypothetical protein
MSVNKTPTKEQLLKAIEQLENNPDDKLGILADLGIAAVGAAGFGAAAAAFGGGVVPILFGLIAIPVAAPLGVVAGAAVLGGAALVGAKKMLFDGTYLEGKKAEILNQLKEQLREVEAKERKSSLGENDKTKFIVFLKEPLKAGIISAEDAHRLMTAVENGQMSLKEAYRLVKNLLNQ